jgi:endonuclease/exonuclease/phosphatase family metal-dependent hydrolase
MYNIKLQHTAEVICDIDADIIALQEIENQNVLKNLLSTLKKAGCAYRYSAITTKRNAPIQIALLSRKLIRYKKELIVSPSPKIRNILEVVVDIDGYPLHIFINHWKSIGYRGFESKRFKYAKTLKARLDILPKNSEYILLGDFNTNYDAKVNFNKKIDDTNGKVALLDILPLIKDSRLADEKLVQNSNRYL